MQMRTASVVPTYRVPDVHSGCVVYRVMPDGKVLIFAICAVCIPSAYILPFTQNDPPRMQPASTTYLQKIDVPNVPSACGSCVKQALNN